MTLLLIVAAVAGLMLLFILPRRVLPLVALIVMVLVPVGYMDLSRTIGRYYTPAVIIIFVWALRLIFAKKEERVAGRPSAAGVLWLPVLGLLTISTIASSSVSLSLSWIATVAVAAILPYYLGRSRAEEVWRGSQIVYVVIALFLGALAASDYFFGINPWTSLFSYDVNEKVWSVFRTRTSLGHPLVTATVASVCTMVALFGQRIPRILRIAGLVGGGAALVLAVSRTSVLAVALGVAVGCLVLLFGPRAESGKSRRLPGFLLLIAGVGFLLVVTNSPLLAERNESTGGVASSMYREESTGVALSMISKHWFIGTGPGTAPTQFAEVYDGPLENSALQLFLSLGVPLASMALLAVAILILRLAFRGEATLAAGLLAFAVSLVGFSAIDVNPAMLALLSPLLYRAGQVLSGVDKRATELALAQPKQTARLGLY
ncbi:MAG: hypothetical protein BGO45_03700 [Microbacterium sp. 71-36]|uniref:O-antigen ligase family protein n=1 Tax=unclassified Microbacterium TaxID=2609290 RepID=UPI00086BD91C|nr:MULTISPECIES: O-antigen ligase family protein [unclassified Microbacterium]MBN9212175.1 O-antigen ligase family protein [Microbacterium sp.]ODT43128.1 MAG: hypothetical protein ABS60_00525 [Microbacterium sp. SCN 71-17]OJV74960.1 MAG: hypothetical protein BGO45_03700 [Microbacterium sp. 71-36]